MIIKTKALQAVTKLAKAQHKWAIKILKNKKWMANASIMSLEMAREYANRTVEELALRAYEYSKMRYEMAKHSNFHPAFRWDVRIWEELNKGVHPDTKVYNFRKTT